MKLYPGEISQVKALTWTPMLVHKYKEVGNLCPNLNWKLAESFKGNPVMKTNSIKKWLKGLKNMSCLKTKLYQEVDLKVNQITMTLIQDLQPRNKNKSDLRKNGKWRDSLKEIQVTWTITKDMKMQRGLQWSLWKIIGLCLKANFNQVRVIKTVMYLIRQSEKDSFVLKDNWELADNIFRETQATLVIIPEEIKFQSLKKSSLKRMIFCLEEGFRVKVHIMRTIYQQWLKRVKVLGQEVNLKLVGNFKVLQIICNNLMRKKV